MNVVEQPLLQNHQLRNAMRVRIYAIILKKMAARAAAAASRSQEKLMRLTNLVDAKLIKLAKSERDYSNLGDLETRIDFLLRILAQQQRRQQQQQQRRRACPPAPASGGFPVTAANIDEVSSAIGSNCQMVDVCRPQLTCAPLTTSNTLPLSTPQHLPALPLPFAASANPYGVVTSSMHPNPLLSVGASFASNHSNPQAMQQTPLLNHHLGNTQSFAQVRQQLFHHEAQRQHSQQQNQHHLQYDQSQLATPLKHGPSLDLYKAALQKQAIYGFKPTKLNPAKDHYIGAQVASSQLPHPHDQSQSAPVLVQMSEKSNGERQHIGAPQVMSNLCPMQPQVVHPCSSARAPISVQTAESKRLPDGNNTSSKQVNGDYFKQLRWLLLVIHARYCSAAQGKCKTEFCLPVQKLWEHMKRCKVPDCTYPRCPKTRKLLIHYTECSNKSCPVCVHVKIFKKKQKRRHRESIESVQAYKKGGAEAISVDEDLQPSAKRLKIEQPSEKTTPETVSVCHASILKQERDGLQSDDYKSVRVEVMPMDIDVSDASGIPVVTRELEKHVAEHIPKGRDGGDSAMDDKNVCLPKEENVDASKMEISSLIELFTPEQVKEHIRGLRQWVGQSKTKADKNKAMGCSISVNACQLCAVERLVFEPLPIYCSPCGVRIKRNALHHSVAAGESRHYVCATCYNESRENSVSVDGTSIPKARLEKKKNDEQVGEGWVQCDKCQAWQHQICALFNSRRNHGEATKYTCPSCYIQEVEHGEKRPLPQSTIPGAKSLPVTALSNHIEQRLFKNLKKERREG